MRILTRLGTEGTANQDNYSSWYLGYETLDDCGCELIAVYNVMRALGKTRSLATLALQFELSGYVMAFGFFGSAPTKLWSCFSFAGLKYGSSFSLSKVEKNIKTSKCGIVSCWNDPYKKGLHTFMVKYTSNRFEAYNGYSNRKNGASLSDVLNADRFIIGYWFS